MQAQILTDNRPSRALCLKCGFREVGTRERYGNVKGIWHDVVLFERRSKRAGGPGLPTKVCECRLVNCGASLISLLYCVLAQTKMVCLNWLSWRLDVREKTIFLFSPRPTERRHCHVYETYGLRPSYLRPKVCRPDPIACCHRRWQ